MKTLLTIFPFLVVWNQEVFVDAGEMAAWQVVGSTADAPQIVMQDDSTGNILYSLCNSGDMPVFPADDTASFNLTDSNYIPKRGTSLAGAGYEQNGSVASLFYMNTKNQIVNTIWQCDKDGHFVPYSSDYQFTISLSADGIIKPDTGLAVVNLGEDDGYRVYFEQTDNTTSMLVYEPVPQTWSLGYNISQDPAKQSPLSVGLTDNNKITLVSPRDDSNIEVSKLNPNGTWSIYTFPTPLKPFQSETDDYWYIPNNETGPFSFELDIQSDTSSTQLEAWDGKTSSIGLTFDSEHGTRRIFYIGTDSQFHCQIEDEDGIWSKCGDVHPDTWPIADSPNAQFATTFAWGKDKIWLFYMSQGKLTQAYRSGIDRWETPETLPNSTTTSSSGHHGGLSTGAKAGIGVGAGVAALALIALLAYIIMQRRKGKNEKEKAEAEADAEAVAATSQPPPESWPSPAPAYTSGVPGGGAWIDGKWTPTPEPNKSGIPWSDRSSYHPVPASPMLSSAGTPQPLHPHVHEMSNDVSYHEMPVEQGGPTNGK
ncbi:hypothetical protein F5Y18DRAFT_360699 [Xylariaceae sp. FL1019]|nr:hypothetical protein F5Y18DRAFT_360699 [Xylariaceae sp. FL1019]